MTKKITAETTAYFQIENENGEHVANIVISQGEDKTKLHIHCSDNKVLVIQPKKDNYIVIKIQ